MLKKTIKPWGYEILLELNSKYVLKKLFIKKNCRCSLQYHNFKVETIYVLSGLLEIEVNSHKKKYKKGEFITIKNKIIHRMKSLEKNTLYLEASTPHLKDVIRIEDDYKRI